MFTKDQLDFILRLTDYFHGHYEDPEWGKRIGNQALVIAATTTFASAIADHETRATVLNALDAAMVKTAQNVTKTAVAPPQNKIKVREAHT